MFVETFSSHHAASQSPSQSHHPATHSTLITVQDIPAYVPCSRFPPNNLRTQHPPVQIPLRASRPYLVPAQHIVPHRYRRSVYPSCATHLLAYTVARQREVCSVCVRRPNFISALPLQYLPTSAPPSAAAAPAERTLSESPPVFVARSNACCDVVSRAEILTCRHSMCRNACQCKKPRKVRGGLEEEREQEK